MFGKTSFASISRSRNAISIKRTTLWNRVNMRRRVTAVYIFLVWYIVSYMQSQRDAHGSEQVSDGGVHSHIKHLFALLETAKEQGVPHTYIHFLGDGRDTAPESAAGYAKELISFLKKEEYGELATVIGRYYAMDRDKRWERVKIAVDGLVKGEGEKAEDAVKAIEERYKKGETDEFLKPIIVNGDEGRIKGEHVCGSICGFERQRLSRRRYAILLQLPL